MLINPLIQIGSPLIIFVGFWSLIIYAIVNIVLKFFRSSTFPKGCNHFFTSFILNLADAKFIKDFWPISLTGYQYKINGKIIVNKLSLVVGDLVTMEENAFVKGKQILDDPFTLNEIFSWCRDRKKKVMIFIVYFEKAYDSVH